jgi:hypothetical protein
MLKNLRHNRFRLAQAGFLSFWYLSLFPGRVGFDTVYAFNMMRNGESTDWWTALYFRTLQVLTLNGQVLYIFSLVGILLLGYGLFYFVDSLGLNSKLSELASLFTIANPIFGVFAVTVQHDVLQASGTFIVLGILVRILRNIHIPGRQLTFLLILSSFLLGQSRTGQLTMVVSTIVIGILLNNRVLIGLVLTLNVLLFQLSLAGIDTTITEKGKFLPFISDLKCIAQHPENEISSEGWVFLNTIAPKEEWMKPQSCAEITNLYFTDNIDYEKLELDFAFISNYLSIISAHPAIFAMGHIQKSAAALPPPFFQGIQNQVDLNYANPIGLGTNIALQSGPTLLHPSIDDPLVRIDIPLFKPLETLAQIPTFLVNQASWFWAWGGLWLWPILFFFTFVLDFRRIRLLYALHPIIILHLVMIVIGVAPTGRHMQPTIILGIFTTAYLILKMGTLLRKISFR